jgi:hypothetical protein
MLRYIFSNFAKTETPAIIILKRDFYYKVHSTYFDAVISY